MLMMREIESISSLFRAGVKPLPLLTGFTRPQSEFQSFLVSLNGRKNLLRRNRFNKRLHRIADKSGSRGALALCAQKTKYFIFTSKTNLDNDISNGTIIMWLK